MKALLVAAAALIAAGCSHVSLVDRSTAKVVTVPSPASSEATYRRLLASLEHCYPVDLRSEGQYFPEAREGQIKFVMANDQYSVRAEVFHAIVRPAGSASSVTYYTQPNWDGRYNAGYEPWVAGRTDVCPRSTRTDPDPNGNWRGNPR